MGWSTFTTCAPISLFHTVYFQAGTESEVLSVQVTGSAWLLSRWIQEGLKVACICIAVRGDGSGHHHECEFAGIDRHGARTKTSKGVSLPHKLVYLEGGERKQDRF